MSDQQIPSGSDLDAGTDLKQYFASSAPTIMPTAGYWTSFDRGGYRYGRMIRENSVEEWMRKLPDGKWTKVFKLPRPIPSPRPDPRIDSKGGTVRAAKKPWWKR